MDLKSYLESRNIDRAEFAQMVGTHSSTITNYINGVRTPTLKIGRMIEIVTKGKVSIDDLLEFDPKNRDSFN